MTDQANPAKRPPFIKNKRLVIAILFAATIAAVFWSQSRVPALNEKAQMGLRTNFSSIAFDIVLPVTAAQPVVERIVRTTINWLYTNWKGMSFGLLFAAAALTILGFVRHRSFKRPWMNTLAGMFMGAPLGVCVNCATPIAQGMYAAGARLETALATLVSSPTLNVIVLSMSFTLLPWEMALGSVLAVLLLLACMPFLINRLTSPSAVRVPSESEASRIAKISPPPVASPADEQDGFVATLWSTTGHYLRNLLYIIKLAVPLMLLAGALGAAVIELAPFDRLSAIAPSLPVLFVTAVLATFLPVPMAFNVVVVMALLANGMNPAIGAVLLFALGVYSIYPATVIARYISVRLSAALAVSVILIATALGMITNSYFDTRLEADQTAITAGLEASNRRVYREALAVCSGLPQALQLRCFAGQIPSLKNLVGYADMCADRPAAVDQLSCAQIVRRISIGERAIRLGSGKPCMALAPEAGRDECLRSVALQTAIKEHDVAQCDQLAPVQAAVQQCRIQYLNSNLLFNPDDSVCTGLHGEEQTDCEINARIYRIADTLDMAACDVLPAKARDHCRWTTASTMVGRTHDTSGCDMLEQPDQQLRCIEQATAWEATRSGSFALCSQLRSPGLADTCLLRVADRQIATLLTNYSLDFVSGAIADDTAADPVRLSGFPMPAAPTLEWSPASEDDTAVVSYVDYREYGRSTGSPMVFSKISAGELGVTRIWNFRLTDFFEPFIIGKGIASGDFDDDLWPDLVLATERGAALYKNTGGRFALLPVDQGALAGKNLFLVALVDADGDGLDDLFASAYGGENFLLMNREAGFARTELISLDGNQRLTMSAGFADLDQDDDLDIVLGNWSSGAEKLFSTEQSGNALLLRDGDGYVSQATGDVKGETNSVLLADIDDDHRPDMLFGNDRMVPDLYYLSNGGLTRQLVSTAQDLVPVTSMFTMSLDTADFNNDLKADLFSTDMTFARSSDAHYCDSIGDDGAKRRCEDLLGAFDIFGSGSAAQCNELDSPADKNDCFVAFSVKAAKTLKDSRYCERLPNKTSVAYSLCQHIAGPVPAEQVLNQNEFLPQSQRNILLLSNGDGFTEKGAEYGVGSSYWSWNAKAADLDNDGWQDIYIGNGFHFGDDFYEVQPNVLYRNLGGHGFTESAADWGLDDPLNTPSYTYMDFDLDGDVDIIATSVLAPPRVFVNQQADNYSVTFLLRQNGRNSRAIGAKITIHYGEDAGLRQRKELKMSGGFMSFDNAVIHFGLGGHDHIDAFTVTWPDGEEAVFDNPLAAGRFYRVRRK